MLSNYFGKCIIGDCVEVVSHFPTESIDLVITTAAMGDDYSYSNYIIEDEEGISSKWDFPKLARELYRVLVPGGVVCWNVGELIINNNESNVPAKHLLYFRELGFRCHATIIVNKKRLRMREEVYPTSFEYVYCLSKGHPRVFNRQHSSKIWEGPSRMEEDLVAGLNNQKKTGKQQFLNTLHPAKTQIWLINDLMLTYSNVDDVILDPFLGSGTVLQIAKKLNRNAIGIEVNEKYAGLYLEDSWT